MPVHIRQSMLTTAIASIDWIAEQMGQINSNMIRKHYGTWINEDGADVVGMLQLALKVSPSAKRPTAVRLVQVRSASRRERTANQRLPEPDSRIASVHFSSCRLTNVSRTAQPSARARSASS